MIDNLYEAEELLEGGQPAEAALLLEELDRRHPEIIKRAYLRTTGLNKNLPYRQIWEFLWLIARHRRPRRDSSMAAPRPVSWDVFLHNLDCCPP